MQFAVVEEKMFTVDERGRKCSLWRSEGENVRRGGVENQIFTVKERRRKCSLRMSGRVVFEH